MLPMLPMATPVLPRWLLSSPPSVLESSLPSTVLLDLTLSTSPLSILLDAPLPSRSVIKCYFTTLSATVTLTSLPT
ncbi:unnamed protein product [Fusarium graminearum]|nr:unnamed protein product [Fusarium graminearum]